jgi:hypothetical protein
LDGIVVGSTFPLIGSSGGTDGGNTLPLIGSSSGGDGGNTLPLISSSTGGTQSSQTSTGDNWATLFAGLSGGEQTEVSTLVNEFLSLVGFPPGLDPFKLDWLLAQSGLFTDAMAAMNFLFGQLTPDQQQANPWAKYGLDAVSYHQKTGSLQAQWYDLTGMDMPADMLAQALSGNWSFQQLQQAAEKQAASTYAHGLDPWLAEGQTFFAAQESYIGSYGHAPTDHAMLAAWWRFRSGAQHTIGRAPAGQMGMTAQAEQRSRDSEVR